MTWVLAVLLLAAPTTGSKLEQGQQAFAQGQFDQAIKLLDAAAAEEKDAAALEKIHLLRGQAFAARQDFGKAEAAFALALDANPEASLDPGKVDPSVVRLLEAMRARTLGTVVFRSTPPGAEVLIDGAPAGNAPGSSSLVIGRHKLEARWSSVGVPPPEGAPPPPGKADRTVSLEVLVHAKRETYVELMLHETETEKIVTVEKIVKVPVEVPVAPPAPKEHFARPWAGVRGVMDVNAGPELGLDLGGGVDFKYLSIGAYVRPVRYFYLVPRVAGLWPVLDVLTLFVEAEVDIRPSRFGIALGGNVGAEVFPLRWLGVFLETGGKGFFVNTGFVVDARFVLAAGARVRLP